MKKPLSCKLGFHQTEGDGGMFTRVETCTKCPWVASKKLADEVARERALWKHYSTEDVSNDYMTYLVGIAMLEGIDPRT